LIWRDDLIDLWIQRIEETMFDFHFTEKHFQAKRKTLKNNIQKSLQNWLNGIIFQANTRFCCIKMETIEKR
jgi:hypothetical protein